MYNPIEAKRRFVQSQIQKSFDSGINIAEEMSNNLEKAKYQVGQPHPNNPNILWTEWQPGKFDWKSKNGRYWKGKTGGTTEKPESDKKSVAKKQLTKDDMKNFVRKITKYTTLVRGDENDFYAEIQCDTDKKADSVERQAKQAGYITKRLSGGKYVRISVDKNNIAQDAGFKKYSQMDIKDVKKALVGKVVTLRYYWSDGHGGNQDAIGEIKNVRLYGKDKLPIAEISYPNGDVQMIRLDEIDDGKMKDSYNTPIVVGDDKTKLDAIKKKIANQRGATSDPRDKIAQDAGFKDYEEMKGYQDYVTQKNLLKKRSTSSGMRLLYQQDIDKYERDHADLIKRISNNNKK